VVAVLAAFVGLGLFAFYEHHPMNAAAAETVAERGDNLFPVFIVQQMPQGLTGLVIAGIFAAAISSLDSALSALSQTIVTGVYRPWRQRRGIAAPNGAAAREPADASSPDVDLAHAKTEVRMARMLVVVWAVLLCGMAQVADAAREHYGDVINLALAMATFTAGPLLASFLLALLRVPVDARGLLWAAPLSVLAVFAISWHQTWAQVVCVTCAGLLLVAWLARLAERASRSVQVNWTDVGRTGLILLACLLCVFLSVYQLDLHETPHHLSVAWPWNVPIGFSVAMLLSYGLAGPQTARNAR
jgi:hypothetical protein